MATVVAGSGSVGTLQAMAESCHIIKRPSPCGQDWLGIRQLICRDGLNRLPAEAALITIYDLSSILQAYKPRSGIGCDRTFPIIP